MVPLTIEVQPLRAFQEEGTARDFSKEVVDQRDLLSRYEAHNSSRNYESVRQAENAPRQPDVFSRATEMLANFRSQDSIPAIDLHADKSTAESELGRTFSYEYVTQLQRQHQQRLTEAMEASNRILASKERDIRDLSEVLLSIVGF
jgi:hypothetical protein